MIGSMTNFEVPPGISIGTLVGAVHSLNGRSIVPCLIGGSTVNLGVVEKSEALNLGFEICGNSSSPTVDCTSIDFWRKCISINFGNTIPVMPGEVTVIGSSGRLVLPVFPANVFVVGVKPPEAGGLFILSPGI